MLPETAKDCSLKRVNVAGVTLYFTRKISRFYEYFCCWFCVWPGCECLSFSDAENNGFSARIVTIILFFWEVKLCGECSVHFARTFNFVLVPNQKTRVVSRSWQFQRVLLFVDNIQKTSNSEAHLWCWYFEIKWTRFCYKKNSPGFICFIFFKLKNIYNTNATN